MPSRELDSWLRIVFGYDDVGSSRFFLKNTSLALRSSDDGLREVFQKEHCLLPVIFQSAFHFAIVIALFQSLSLVVLAFATHQCQFDFDQSTL